MFESLQEEIENTEVRQPIKERLFRWVAIVVGSAILFGGLYLAITALE